ncbi:thiol-disulfide oxidoreductase [Chryseomicrobium excrementi]|uniref:Thiol-disulfide oxidoreductase n=1 Tax=Chryseomicrobium excrementi TaxID=2041346 RepID=A0A2M9EXH2_9BACL|nr:thiol-disulfide oxidoreductase DCC family protein [Chryseomicrobium excrementi]PJK15912.1 thiol-disulfide oxidoreductase [Chryseomicrobium excrementi]
MKPEQIVLYDGVCNFCDSSVQFIWKRDSRGIIHFASLQSEQAQTILRQQQIPADTDSFIFIDKGKAYVESDAAFRVARYLDKPWKYLAAGHVVPKFLRNAGYRLIARNRYKWFGKKEACSIPPVAVRARFLDA